MTMPLQPRTRLLLISLLVLANNLAWIYLTPGAGSDPALGRAAPASADYECAKQGEQGMGTLAAAENQNMEWVPKDAATGIELTAASQTHSPLGTATDATDIPSELSQDVLLRRQLDRVMA